VILSNQISLDRLESFKKNIVNTGFLKLPETNIVDKSGYVCYTFNESVPHQVCYERGNEVSNIIVDVEREIKSLIDISSKKEYRPNVFFYLESKMVDENYGRNLIAVRSIKTALDPNGLVIKDDLSTDNYVDITMDIYNVIWEAVIDHVIYTEYGVNNVRFIGYIQDLSVNNHKEDPLKSSESDFTVFKILFGIILSIVSGFILVCIFLTIRKKINDSKNHEFKKVVNEISDSTSDDLEPIPTYPVYLETNKDEN